jgi:hypothetical protein
MYQFTSNDHALTLKGKLKRKISSADPSTNSISVSGTYVYDRTMSLQVGFDNVRGNGPASDDYIADIGYMPFNKEALSNSPWATGRIGVQYTHSDNNLGTAGDTALVYSYISF